ncbi:MAG: PAS domain S-box protein [Candidatus Hydrogenedentes bacterium]|nr:PAS domain S-box protein [Candidatus Hydrogenedentota bacterium]
MTQTPKRSRAGKSGSAAANPAPSSIPQRPRVISPPVQRTEQFLPGDVAWTRAIVENAVDGIIIINERGLIEFFNPAAERLFGFEAYEVLGKNVTVLMPQPYRDEHDGYLDSYVATGKAKIIGIGREVTGRRKDGSTFPFELSVSEVLLDDRRIFTGIVHDITRRRQAQEEKDRLLRDLNKRNIEITCLYRVEESIRSREFLTDIFTDVVTLVEPACLYPDIARARLTFDDAVYVASPFDETPWRLTVDIIVAGRKRGSIEFFYLEQRPDEDEGPFLKEERGLIEAVASVLGETVERREAEAKVIQASKLASIGELAAGVGHEINNPVNGIMNCADILIQQSEPGTKMRQFSELIRSEADRIARIVHNLLTFSRQEKERHSPARLCDIVEAVLSLSRKRLIKSHVDLRVDVSKDLPKLKCRSEQLQQVVMNLLINSLHALDERYPEIDPDKILSISARQIQNNGASFVRLTVDDHGCGIAPSNLHRLFDPFFTTKGRDKGTGLGLSVSDGIVKDHGGTITIESELGVFTRFHVDLPLKNSWSLEEPRS